MKPKLFESLMQRDGEFKQSIEGLSRMVITHPFLKRYCDTGVKEGLFSDTIAALGRMHDTLVEAAYPEMMGRNIVTVRPSTEAMEHFPLDEKSVAYRYAEGSATRLSGKKFGTVAPEEGDIIQVKVHHGCTKEVSSFECLLQNWNGKYSPNGTSPISVGLDGSLSLGRASNVPLLLTCHVENVRYESTPSENYLHVSGRCWGERLFRRVVTKTYENMKGEDIVTDLIDHYVGLSHTRNSTELIEDTDTTYTKLVYEDTPVMDILTFIAESADKTGLIGYDFRVAPDAKFEFFPRNSKASSVNLLDKIESSDYSIDIHRVRNRVTAYGAADRSTPADKDAWTESLTPDDAVGTPFPERSASTRRRT